MAFPVYALPDDQLIENLEHIDVSIYEDGITNDGSDDYLLTYGPILRSPSINPDSPFQIYGYEIIDVDGEGFRISLNYSGTPPTNYIGFIGSVINNSGSSVNGAVTNLIANPNVVFPYIAPYYQYGGTINQIGFFSDSSQSSYVVGISVGTITEDMADQTFGADTDTISYLSSVSQVFQWLLTAIGTFIVFLIGNPFLAVMLCLFLAGTVVSFFVRIRG